MMLDSRKERYAKRRHTIAKRKIKKRKNVKDEKEEAAKRTCNKRKRREKELKEEMQTVNKPNADEKREKKLIEGSVTRLNDS